MKNFFYIIPDVTLHYCKQIFIIRLHKIIEYVKTIDA